MEVVAINRQRTMVRNENMNMTKSRKRTVKKQLVSILIATSEYSMTGAELELSARIPNSSSLTEAADWSCVSDLDACFRSTVIQTRSSFFVVVLAN
jgi:hypothetical protein